MKTLETAHHQATALAAELQEAMQRDRVEDEETTKVQAQRKYLQESLGFARRVVTLAVALGKEVDEAFLLDLRSEVAEDMGIEERGEEGEDDLEEGSVY